MKLRRYLDLEKKPAYLFAREAGVPKNAVYFIAKHGYAPPGTTLATLKGISQHTNGEVRLEDMVNGEPNG